MPIPPMSSKENTNTYFLCIEDICIKISIAIDEFDITNNVKISMSQIEKTSGKKVLGMSGLFLIKMLKLFLSESVTNT